MATEELKVRITAENEDYKKKMTEAEKKLENFKQSVKDTSIKYVKGFTNATVALANSAKVATIAIGKAAIEAYGEYEQLRDGAKKLWGEAFDTMAGHAALAYSKVQMSVNDYYRAVNPLAVGLKEALNGNAEAAGDLANRIVEAQADIVAATGLSAEAVQNAFNGVIKGNYTMLDNLGLGIAGTKEGMQELIDKVNEYNEAQGKATRYDINNIADRYEALIQYVEMAGMAGTAAAEAAGTIQGSIGMTKAAWANLLTAFADESQDVARAVNILTSSLTHVIDNVGDRIEQMLPRIIDGLDQLISQVLTKLTDLAGQLAPNFIKAIEGLSKILISAFSALIGIIAQEAPKIIEAFVSIMGALGEAIDSAVNDIINNLPEIISSLASGLVDGAIIIFNSAITLFRGICEAIPVIVEQVGQLLPELIQKIGTFLEQGVSTILSSALYMLSGIVKAIPTVAQGIGQALPDLITSIANTLVDGIDIIINAGIELFNGLIEAIPIAIGNILAKIPDIITAIIQGLMRGVNALVKGFIKLFLAFAKAIPTIITNISQLIPQVITAIVETITGSIDEIANGFIELFNGIIDVIPDIITTVSQVVPEIIGALLQGILDGRDAIVEGFINLFNAVLQQLPIIFNQIVSLLPDLLMAIVQGITDGIPLLIDGFNQLFKSFLTALPDIITMIGDALPDLIIGIVNALTANIGTLIEGFVELFKAFTQAIPQIVDAIKDALPELIQGIVDGLIAGMDALIEGFVELFKAFIDAIPDIVAVLQENSDEIVNGIVEGLLECSDTLVEGFVELFMAIWDALPEILSALREASGSLINHLVEYLFEDILQLVGVGEEAAKNFCKGFSEFLTGMLNAATGMPSMGGETVGAIAVEAAKARGQEAGESSGQAYADGISSKEKEVANSTNVLNKTIEKTLKDGIAGITEASNKVSAVVPAAYEDIPQKVKQKINETMGGVKQELSNSTTDITNSANEQKDAVVNGYTDMASEAEAPLEQLNSTLEDKMSSIEETVNETVENVVSAVEDMVSQLLDSVDFEWELPYLKIPHLSVSGRFNTNPPSVPVYSISWYAHGGVFDTPTLFGFGNGRIGGLGENGAEAIVPLENNTEWLDRIAERLGAGSSRPIVLQVDGKTFAETSVDSINALTRQTGKLGLVLV